MVQSLAEARVRECVDRFYMTNGPCCAGCDWWSFANSVVGECRMSAPVGGAERTAMLGMTGCSLPPAAGRVMTRREHHCGDFKDTFNWSTLPREYLGRIRYSKATP